MEAGVLLSGNTERPATGFKAVILRGFSGHHLKCEAAFTFMVTRGWWLQRHIDSVGQFTPQSIPLALKTTR